MTTTFKIKKILPIEKTSVIVLICCTILSMAIANSSWGEQYLNCWNYDILGSSIQHWINEGLMSIFFLMIGLELKREFVFGELSNPKIGILPIVSAIGGAIIPVLIFLLFNHESIQAKAAGIPMATDIAFAIGLLSLLGKTVPASLKVFLTTLAVIDDLMAILVIAFFYTNTISMGSLIISFAILLILFLINQFKINNLIIYIIGGIIMWYFMLDSGIHATITGVLLASVIPIGNGNSKSSFMKLHHILHKPVAFIIVPLFALANTGIELHSIWQYGIVSNLSAGIILGLLLGKPIGILIFSKLFVTLRICQLPYDVNWKHILGVGILAGIGFTMSIFITLLACTNKIDIDRATISILIASTIAGITGLGFLKLNAKK